MHYWVDMATAADDVEKVGREGEIGDLGRHLPASTSTWKVPVCDGYSTSEICQTVG